ncbi:MAG: hypothetical protein AAGD43_00880 [Pseudomonadota bacterium]
MIMPKLALKISISRIANFSAGWFANLNPSDYSGHDPLGLACKTSCTVFVKENELGTIHERALVNHLSSYLAPWNWTDVMWHVAISNGEAMPNWLFAKEESDPKTALDGGGKIVLARLDKRAPTLSGNLTSWKELSTKYVFDDILKQSANPSASFSAFIAKDTFEEKYYKDVTTPNVQATLENLARLPATLAFNLDLVGYFGLFIEKNLLSDESANFVGLAPEFTVDLRDGSSRTFTPNEDEDADPTPFQRNSIWSMAGSGDDGPLMKADAYIRMSRFDKPMMEFAAFTSAERSVSLIEPRTQMIRAFTRDAEAQIPERQQVVLNRMLSRYAEAPDNAREQLTKRALVASEQELGEVYDENWLALLPERLGSAYDPVGAMLDAWPTDVTEQRKWLVVLLSLLKERAGPGGIAGPDEAVPAVDWMTAIAESETTSEPVRRGLARALFGLAEDERLGALEQGAYGLWLDTLANFLAERDGQLEMIIRSVPKVPDFTDLDSIRIDPTRDRAERLARLLTTEDELGSLIVAQWQAILDRSYGSEAALGAYWQVPEMDAVGPHPQPANLIGLIDLTRPEAICEFGMALTGPANFSLHVHNRSTDVAGDLSDGAVATLKFVPTVDGVSNAVLTIGGTDHVLRVLDDVSGLINAPLKLSDGVIDIRLYRDKDDNQYLIKFALSVPPVWLERDEIKPVELEAKFLATDGGISLASSEMWFSAAVKSGSRYAVTQASVPLTAAVPGLETAGEANAGRTDLKGVAKAIAALRPRASLATAAIAPAWNYVTQELDVDGKLENPWQKAIDEAKVALKALLETGRLGDTALVGAPRPSSIPDIVRESIVDAHAKRLDVAVPMAFPNSTSDFRPRPNALDLSIRYDRLLRDAALKDNDIWPLANGYALMLAVSPTDVLDGNGKLKDVSGHWLSLNAATLVPQTSPDLATPVNPIPIAPPETASSRDAIAPFANRSLVGRMPGDVQRDPLGLNAILDGLLSAERYDNTYYVLPHIAFGTEIALTGFVAGIGDTLPALWQSDTHPAVLPEHPMKSGVVGEKTVASKYVHRVRYLRNVPISVPRLDDRGNLRVPPRTPEGVAPLASELDQFEPLLYMRAGDERTFHRAAGSGRLGIQLRQSLVVDIRELSLDDGANLTWELGASTRYLVIEIIFKRDALKVEPKVDLAERKLTLTVSRPNQEAVTLRIVHGSFSTKEVLSGEELRSRAALTGTAKQVFHVFASNVAHRHFDGDGWTEGLFKTTEEPQWVHAKVDADGLDIFDVGTGPKDIEGAWITLQLKKGRASLIPPQLLLGSVAPENGIATKAPAPDTILPAPPQRVGDIDDEAPLPQTVVLPFSVSPGETTLCHVRPPGLDFRTWTRAFLDVPGKRPEDWKMDDRRPDLVAAANLLRDFENTTTTGIRTPEPVFDDPHVTHGVVRVTQIYPPVADEHTQVVAFEWPRTDSGFDDRHRRSGIPVKIKVAGNDNANPVELTFDSDGSKSININNAAVGSIIEVSIHGAARAELFDETNDEAYKFNALYADGRRLRANVALQDEEIIVGAPLRFRIEVPIDVLPTSDDLYQAFVVGEPLLGAEDGIRVFRLRAPEALADASTLTLQQLRYVKSYKITPQKWIWLGRPVHSPGLIRELSDGAIRNSWMNSWMEMAYTARPDNVTSPARTGRLTRERIPSLGLDPKLDSYDTNYQGISQHWRFGFEVESRYRRGDRPNAQRTAVRRGTEGGSSWKPTLVRGDIETEPESTERLSGSSSLARPSVAQFIPLTQPLDFDGGSGELLPPMLILLDDTFHQNGAIGDAVECVLAGGRHPIRASNRKPSETDVFPEFGPDPVYSTKTTNGESVPLRVEGVVGLSQSALAESGEQRRSAIVVTVDDRAIDESVRRHLRQSPFAKLQVRRYRDPLLSDVRLSDENDLGFQRDEVDEKIVSVVLEPNGPGVAIIACLPKKQPDEAVETITFTLQTGNVLTNFTAERPDNQKVVLKISETTDDGEPVWSAGKTSIIAGDVPAYLRVLVSGVGQKPDGSVKAYSATLSVATTKAIQRSVEHGEDPWRSTLPVAIDSGDQSDALIIKLPKKPGGALPDNVLLLRPDVSPFTEAAWSQFTPDASRFGVDVEKDNKGVQRVESLYGIIENDGPNRKIFSLRLNNAEGNVTKLRPTVELEPNTKANALTQGEILAVAIVTKYIIDATGKLAEEFIHTRELSELLKPENGDQVAESLDDAQLGGRIRIATILHRATKKLETKKDATSIVRELFTVRRSDEVDPDAAADLEYRCVGFSRPINFTIKTEH